MRCRPAGTCGQLLSVTEQLSIAIDFLQEKVRNRACVDGMAEDDDTGICGCARSPIPNRSRHISRILTLRARADSGCTNQLYDEYDEAGAAPH